MKRKVVLMILIVRAIETQRPQRAMELFWTLESKLSIWDKCGVGAYLLGVAWLFTTAIKIRLGY